MCKICSKLTMKTPEWLNVQKNVNDVFLVSLMLTLNRFHILIWFFHCWLWASKYLLGYTFLTSWYNNNTLSHWSIHDWLFDSFFARYPINTWMIRLTSNYSLTKRSYNSYYGPSRASYAIQFVNFWEMLFD